MRRPTRRTPSASGLQAPLGSPFRSRGGSMCPKPASCPNGSAALGGDDRPDQQPDQGRGRGVHHPAEHGPDDLDGVVGGDLQVVNEVIGRVPAEVVRADEQDVAADPDHRGDADDRDHREQLRHRTDQAHADLLRRRRRSLAEQQATVVHLHDQADDPYTSTVMPIATTTRIRAREIKGGPTTSFSAITMSSVESDEVASGSLRDHEPCPPRGPGWPTARRGPRYRAARPRPTPPPLAEVRRSGPSQRRDQTMRGTCSEQPRRGRTGPPR